MAREKETKVLRRTENLKQILESKPEEYGNFYRTKDIYRVDTTGLLLKKFKLLHHPEDILVGEQIAHRN